MPLLNKKPHGLLWFGFRLPILLYRLNLGWLLGQRFIQLTHVGRKSGLPHQTVIEVVHHNEQTDVYYVVSGFGKKSDWFLNIKNNPDVSITTGRRTLLAHASEIPKTMGAKILMDYAKYHPMAFKELSTILIGKSIEPTEENCHEFLESMPMVAFEPRKSEAARV